MAITSDFIIVGAGYAGLMAALTLSQAGAKVTVIDAQPIGGNTDSLLGHTQSAISGGHVVIGFSQDYASVISNYGLDYARQLFNLSVQGVNKVEELCSKIEGASFRRGYLILARNSREESMLQTILDEHIALGASPKCMRIIKSQIAPSMINSPDFQHDYLHSSVSGQLEPYSYVIGLAKMAIDAGVQFMPQTRVIDIKTRKSTVTIKTDNNNVLTASKLIVSGGPFFLRSGLFPIMRRYQAVIGNAAVKTEPLSSNICDLLFPSGYQGAFADMRHTDVLYARLDDQNRLDFGAYSFSGTQPNFKAVEKLLYKTFPQLIDHSIGIQGRRYGFLAGSKIETLQLFQEIDGEVRPCRSFNHESPLTILSGFGGAGINLGTVAGQAAAEAYLGKPQTINILAHLEHPTLPITFPWERANQWRDTIFTESLSWLDRGTSIDGIAGSLCRRVVAQVI